MQTNGSIILHKLNLAFSIFTCTWIRRKSRKRNPFSDFLLIFFLRSFARLFSAFPIFSFPPSWSMKVFCSLSWHQLAKQFQISVYINKSLSKVLLYLLTHFFFLLFLFLEWLMMLTRRKREKLGWLSWRDMSKVKKKKTSAEKRMEWYRLSR